MKSTLPLTAVLGALCLGWANATTCTSFDLPDPTETNVQGKPSAAETRVLWGESYCKELTLKELNGKTPKLCVRNENPVDLTPTGCLRFSLRYVDPALIKELRVGIHPDCGSIPAESKDKFQRRRSATRLAADMKMGAIRICFDEIPAAETCCETVQCLLYEAVVEVAGVDTQVTIEDGACSSEEGCPYSIGCPNLINEQNPDEHIPSLFGGTNSNDLFILPEPEGESNFVLTYDGYDVVIGSEGAEIVSSYTPSSGGLTAFLNGGNDYVISTDEPEKIYFGEGDDSVKSNSQDGYQDLFYGGPGTNTYTGLFDDDDVLKNFSGV